MLNDCALEIMETNGLPAFVASMGGLLSRRCGSKGNFIRPQVHSLHLFRNQATGHRQIEFNGMIDPDQFVVCFASVPMLLNNVKWIDVVAQFSRQAEEPRLCLEICHDDRRY